MQSYWEKDIWSSVFDCIVVGAGFSGLNAAIEFKKKYPDSRVLVIDQNMFFNGASTKNAGFVCFGSPGEILSDLRLIGKEETKKLVHLRWEGAQRIRERFTRFSFDYQPCDAFELFREEELTYYNSCREGLEEVNGLLEEVTQKEVPTYQLSKPKAQAPNLRAVLIKGEGQVHPALLHKSLIFEAQQLGVQLLNGHRVLHIEQDKEKASLFCDNGLELNSNLVLNCSNAFDCALTPKSPVKPARAQVLITSEVEELPWKGNFHMDEGFIYFRNVGKRLLLGGARNLAFEEETTLENELNPSIQGFLERLLSEELLKDRPFQIEHRWTGIMGFSENKAIGIRQNGLVFHLAGLNGMGVALSFSLSRQLVAQL